MATKELNPKQPGGAAKTDNPSGLSPVESPKSFQDLESQNRRLRAMLDDLPDIVMEVDADKKYVWANRAGFNFFGDDLLGREAADYFEGEQDTYQQVAPVFMGGEDEIYIESWQRRKDGAKRLLAWWCRVLKDGQGQVTGAISSARDVTEQKKIEAELSLRYQELETQDSERKSALSEMVADLRESEEKFRAVFEWAAIGIARVGVDGHWLEVNRRLCDIVGYSPEELLKKTFQDITHPQDLDSDVAQVRAVLAGEINSYTIQKRYLRNPANGGGEVWVNLTAALVRDGSGNPKFFVSMIEDINDRKQAESVRDRLLAIIEATSDFIGTADPNGNAFFINRAGRKMVGFPETGDLGSLRIPDFYPPEEAERIMAEAIPVAVREGVWDGESVLRHRNGSLIPVSEVIMTHKRPNGELDYISTIVRDLSARIQVERQLKKTLTDLERSNLELEQFAYVASHDLQEPLRMVASYVQLLARRYQGKLDGDADDFINYAVDGANRMKSMIQDLLTLSRVATRGNPPTMVDANSALGEALAYLRAPVEENRAVVTNEELPTVMADEMQLVQIFQNLIANAIKFCGENSPRIHIGTRQIDGELTFYVKDHGLGIDPQYHERIFIIFQRLHGREEYAGSGIGLSICKKIVERHGGRIWLESEVGQGTTFFFTLPSAQDE